MGEVQHRGRIVRLPEPERPDPFAILGVARFALWLSMVAVVLSAVALAFSVYALVQHG